MVFGVEQRAGNDVAIRPEARAGCENKRAFRGKSKFGIGRRVNRCADAKLDSRWRDSGRIDDENDNAFGITCRESADERPFDSRHRPATRIGEEYPPGIGRRRGIDIVRADEDIGRIAGSIGGAIEILRRAMVIRDNAPAMAFAAWEIDRIICIGYSCRNDCAIDYDIVIEIAGAGRSVPNEINRRGRRRKHRCRSRGNHDRRAGRNKIDGYRYRVPILGWNQRTVGDMKKITRCSCWI